MKQISFTINSIPLPFLMLSLASSWKFYNNFSTHQLYPLLGSAWSYWKLDVKKIDEQEVGYQDQFTVWGKKVINKIFILLSIYLEEMVYFWPYIH